MAGETPDKPESQLPPDTQETPQESAADDLADTAKEADVHDPLALAIAEQDELKDQLLRSRAEMENYRKRVNREREDERRYASLAIVRDLLPAMDNLQRAIDAGGEDSAENSVLQGVRMVLKQIEEILTRHGVEVISAMGQPFDPHFHEALQQVPSAEHPPNTVLQELERGYRMHERVVRPSKVIVSTNPT